MINFNHFSFFRFPVLSIFEITPWSSPATTDVVAAADRCGNCFLLSPSGLFLFKFYFFLMHFHSGPIHPSTVFCSFVKTEKCECLSLFFLLAGDNKLSKANLGCVLLRWFLGVCVFISRPCIHIRQFPVFFFLFSLSK